MEKNIAFYISILTNILKGTGPPSETMEENIEVTLDWNIRHQLSKGRVRFGAADSAPPIRCRRFGAGQFGAEHFGAGTIRRQNFFF